MTIEPVKIIIIDDNWDENDPVNVELREIVGKKNVVLKSKSSEGLSWIKKHLPGKLIVLLDLDMGTGQKKGYEIFDEIRKETSLVYVIIITAIDRSDIPQEKLIKFINNDALAFVSKTASTKEILKIIEKAKHQLDARVDCVMEQWISKQPEEKISKPYLADPVTRKTYSLKDIMTEIRLQTNFGKDMEKKILYLAIDLFAQKNENNND